MLSLYYSLKIEITEKLRQLQIDWKFNPPAASHMGGVWERQIRTVRKILCFLLHEHGGRLDDESLQTLMCEVESIINSRPLTAISSDVKDPIPLSPGQILTMKTSVVLPPLTIFNGMTYTCAGVGVEFSTSVTFSGRDGRRSTCQRFRSVPSRTKKSET